MKSTRVYDFNIPALGAFQLPVTGSFFRIMTASAAIEVQGDSFGNIYPVNTGQGLKNQDFKSLNLVNRSGAIIIGTIIVSDGEFVDDRITGDVSVIDGEKTRSISGNSYQGCPGIGAIAAQFSQCQLWNPNASGRNLIVTSYILTTSVAASIFIIPSSQVLNSDVTAVKASNKKFGAAYTGVAKVQEASVAVLDPRTYGLSGIYPLSANAPILIVEKNPIVIPPNFGMLVECITANITLNTVFNWFEEAV